MVHVNTLDCIIKHLHELYGMCINGWDSAVQNRPNTSLTDFFRIRDNSDLQDVFIFAFNNMFALNINHINKDCR